MKIVFKPIKAVPCTVCGTMTAHVQKSGAAVCKRCTEFGCVR